MIGHRLDGTGMLLSTTKPGLQGARTLPTPHSRGLALGLAVTVMLLAITSAAGLMRQSPSTAIPVGLFLALAILPTGYFYRWPAMYLFRMALLGAPGIAAGSIQFFTEFTVRISDHGREFQNAEITSILVTGTAMALASSAIGWGLAIRKQPEVRPIVPSRQFHLRFMAYALMAFFGGVFAALSLGPVVWTAAYASESSTPVLAIGTFPTLAAIGLLGIFTLRITHPSPPPYATPVFYCLLAFVVFYCLLFRGARLEAFAVVAAMILLRYTITGTTRRPRHLVIVGVVSFVAAQVWGLYRSGSAVGQNIGQAFVAIFVNTTLPASDGVATAQVGTVGDIASTFYQVIGLINDKTLHFLAGQSYLDYIPRTLPEFLNPARPEDLAWIFVNVNRTSGGGFFELAEAYINFGLLGCMVVPALITYLLGRLHVRTVRTPTHSLVFAYAVCLMALPRGIWYQTFALYKTFLILIVVEFLVTLMVNTAAPSQRRPARA